jgi:hypothetical protein
MKRCAAAPHHTNARNCGLVTPGLVPDKPGHDGESASTFRKSVLVRPDQLFDRRGEQTGIAAEECRIVMAPNFTSASRSGIHSSRRSRNAKARRENT